METLHIIDQLQPEKLAYSITGFSQATDIGTSTLYEDAKSGKLKTRLLGDGKRKKRIITRDDGIEYLHAFPAGYREDAA